MVLSLVDLSLRSITKGIKDGTIRHPHLLPPNLRERVLDTAIKQDLANHPNGLEVLTPIEFLNGMTSISAKACKDSDTEFLERLIESLATKLPNGETVGDGIKELNLKIFDYGAPGSDFKNEKTYWEIMSKVYDLIAHCPNTASMAFHMKKSEDATDGYWPFNENENSACNRVMENLINLSVVCNGNKILDDWYRPMINFKQLKTLKLDSCYFYINSWPKLLGKIPLLENLHFFDVNSYQHELDWILPFPLPHLKSLEVLGGRIFTCNKAFVDKLMECQQLRQLRLYLSETSTDEKSLVQLASMDIDLKMRICLFVRGNDAAEIASILDSSSHFKHVRIFHEMIESFELDVREWNAQFSTVLEDVFNTCSNLTSFGIRFRTNHEFGESKRFNAALVQFFGNPERAHQLKVLSLRGNFDENVLFAVFESCLNLVRLKIYECPNLRDQHLIDWVSRDGGKLTQLVLEKCTNVTSEGIIPILAKSGEGLLHYYCSDLGQDNGGQNWETILRNHCPNAVDDEFPLLSIS